MPIMCGNFYQGLTDNYVSLWVLPRRHGKCVPTGVTEMRLAAPLTLPPHLTLLLKQTRNLT